MRAKGKNGCVKHRRTQRARQLILMPPARQGRVKDKARTQRLCGHPQVDHVTTPNAATVGQKNFDRIAHSAIDLSGP